MISPVPADETVMEGCVETEGTSTVRVLEEENPAVLVQVSVYVLLEVSTPVLMASLELYPEFDGKFGPLKTHLSALETFHTNVVERIESVSGCEILNSVMEGVVAFATVTYPLQMLPSLP